MIILFIRYIRTLGYLNCVYLECMQKNSGQEEKNMMTFVCTGLFMIFKAII